MNEKKNIGAVSRRVKLRRAVWCIVSALAFRPFGTKLFRVWRILLLRAFGAQIHGSAEVYASAEVWAPWNLTLERGACLGPHVICYNQAPVVLRSDSCVSQYAYICTAGHDLSEVNNARRSLIVASVVLERGAWIGARAFVGPGVIVGERSVVGAAAAVFRDVAPATVVGGNPAQIIKRIVTVG